MTSLLVMRTPIQTNPEKLQHGRCSFSCCCSPSFHPLLLPTIPGLTETAPPVFPLRTSGPAGRASAPSMAPARPSTRSAFARIGYGLKEYGQRSSSPTEYAPGESGARRYIHAGSSAAPDTAGPGGDVYRLPDPAHRACAGWAAIAFGPSVAARAATVWRAENAVNPWPRHPGAARPACVGRGGAVSGQQCDAGAVIAGWAAAASR
jgi:hypothetical protein